MNTHKNARLTPYLRQEACRREAAGVPVAQVAHELAVSRTTIYTWLKRHDEPDTRSSRPHHSPTRIRRRWRRQIRKRRGQRWSGRRIAQHCGIPLATAGRKLRRRGLGVMT